MGDPANPRVSNGVPRETSLLTPAQKNQPINSNQRDRQGTNYLALSPQVQREHIATALDRMGGAVVEIRDAYQRWVARKTVDAESAAHMPSTMRVHDTKDKFKCEAGAIRAMTELRVPMEMAEVACEGVGSLLSYISFSEFVGRYAGAAGLVENTPCREGEVWVEGPGGVWVQMPAICLHGARAVFDEATEAQEEKAFDSKGALTFMNSHGLDAMIGTIQVLSVPVKIDSFLWVALSGGSSVSRLPSPCSCSNTLGLGITLQSTLQHGKKIGMGSCRSGTKI